MLRLRRSRTQSPQDCSFELMFFLSSLEIKDELTIFYHHEGGQDRDRVVCRKVLSFLGSANDAECDSLRCQGSGNLLIFQEVFFP